MNIFEGIMWWWKNRKKIDDIKKQVLEVKDAIHEAKKNNGKITKEELKKILKESDDVLDLIIELLE